MDGAGTRRNPVPEFVKVFPGGKGPFPRRFDPGTVLRVDPAFVVLEGQRFIGSKAEKFFQERGSFNRTAREVDSEKPQPGQFLNFLEEIFPFFREVLPVRRRGENLRRLRNFKIDRRPSLVRRNFSRGRLPPGEEGSKSCGEQEAADGGEAEAPGRKVRLGCLGRRGTEEDGHEGEEKGKSGRAGQISLSVRAFRQPFTE
jgi:hypothetical protein